MSASSRSTFLTTVIILLTAALAYFSYVANQTGEKMLRNAERQRLNSTLPVLSVSVGGTRLEHDGKSGVVFPLIITNEGQGPAINPIFNWTTSNQSRLVPGLSTAAIGPGQTLSTKRTVRYPGDR